MRPSDATRRLLLRIALACVGIGLLAFAASDALWAREAYLTLDDARDAMADANWRSNDVPALPGGPLFGMLGIAGIALLLVLAVSRTLPTESRRPVGLALAIIALGILVSFARRFVDRSHDHEGAWGALQVGIMTSALVVLVWRSVPARVVGLAGSVVLTLRQPLIWRASDEYVRATGEATAAYGAEIARMTAFSVGATGALLVAIALVLAATSRSRREAAGKETGIEKGDRETPPTLHSSEDGARGAI